MVWVRDVARDDFRINIRDCGNHNLLFVLSNAHKKILIGGANNRDVVYLLKGKKRFKLSENNP